METRIRASTFSYKKILQEKHAIEEEYQRAVSLSFALDILLDADQPKWMDKPRIRVIIKKQIRVHIDLSRCVQDDGEWYVDLKPGEYEIDEIEAFDDDGSNRYDLVVPMVASFWTTDVDQKDWSTQ